MYFIITRGPSFLFFNGGGRLSSPSSTFFLRLFWFFSVTLRMSGETTETRPVTRSMSGTTKKTDSKIVVKDEQKAAKRASNKSKSGTTKIIRTPGYSIAPWTWKDEAYSLFIKEYKEKHYKRPPSATGKIIPKELRLAIRQAWRGMSDKEKAPYIERAEKIEAERVRAEKMADEMRAKGLL